MLEWSLAESISPEGQVTNRTRAIWLRTPYFAAAFLDTIGFFDRRKRFWTDRPFPGAGSIRTGMIRELGRLNPNLTMVSDTLERLGAAARPFTNAVR